MKTVVSCRFVVALVCLATHVQIAFAVSRPVPRPALLERLEGDCDIYGIVHWNINTYTDREWGFGDEDPSLLNPSSFDADKIVRACAAGGLKGLIVVAKHHDGFCLWPTKTTEHNISKSPFRGGRGDYVREMADACRANVVRFGVYVSPWDRNHPRYAGPEYVEAYHAQIRELLNGDYGEVFEMWFDNANGGDGYYGGAREKRKIVPGYYRFDEVFRFVRELQPKICIFNEDDAADFRFGGTETGIVDPDSRATGGHYDGTWENYEKWANTGLRDGTTFHPIEADFPLRKNWFYHAADKGKTKSSAYLMKLYLSSVGNAATMNIGISPNREGLLDDEDVRALKGFTEIREAFFSREVKAGGEPFNVIVMAEDVSKGEQVDAWRFLADGKAILSGKSIGRRRIRVLDEPISPKVCELKIDADGGNLGQVAWKRYFADPALVARVKAATTDSGETDTAMWMTAASAAKSVRLESGRTQLYVADDAPAVTRYAADELRDRLSESFGSKVPVTNVFLQGYAAIVVGDNAEARAAGIDVNALPRDGGLVRTRDGRVYIAGFDDGSVKNVWNCLRYGGICGNSYERGTVFAAYEFLERFAGVRYYFPGELGTIVPRRRAIVVPAGDIVNVPDFTHRTYSAWADGQWFEPGGETNRVVQYYRNRLQTTWIPCSHGQNEFSYLHRFAKTHPEYFRQMPDGTRNLDATASQPGHLCHTSAVWDEIYADVRSYFLGEGPEKRGVPDAYTKQGYKWNVNTREIKGLGKFADIMPQDGFQPCCCSACAAAFGEKKGAYATDLIWQRVAEVGFRLKKEGIPGTITMMGYWPYSDVPEFPLPDNLMVMVARMGPWAVGNPAGLAREQGEIRAWSEKLGKKVWLWNYPCKFRGEFPDIPEHCPRAWAKYYQELSPVIFGAYAQTASTRWLYNHLNNYVFGKVCWNNKTDVDALLEEYYRLMYGAGAPGMRRFFEALERLWVTGVVGRVDETPLGPVVSSPSDYELFKKVYCPKNLARIGSALDDAAAAVAAGSLEARRIALMRRELFEPLAKRANDYLESVDVKRALKARGKAPTLLVNGDFADGLKGWAGPAVLDTNVFVTAGASARLVSTNGEWRDISQRLNVEGRDLKPSTRYRLTYFVRYENVVPTKSRWCGVYSNVWSGGNKYPSLFGHKGTADWIAQTFDFESAPEAGGHAYVSFKIMNATGTVWFDGIRLEELSE